MFFLQRGFLYHPVAAGSGPDPDGPAIQIVNIDTADGERLVGWWLPPEPGKPTILFFNGNAAGLAIQEGRWRRIADRGVGFLAIAYRGYDGSTGKPRRQVYARTPAPPTAGWCGESTRRTSSSTASRWAAG